MMSPPAEGVSHEPPAVWQSRVELGGSVVAVGAQRIQQGIGLADGTHASKDIDDRLGGESWNSSASDMFDRGETPRQEVHKAIPLRYELRPPSRIVRCKVNFFGDGAG